MTFPADRIGPFTVGEIPEPLVYRFVDADDNPIDLTGFDARFQWGERGSGTTFLNSTTEIASVTDAVNGEVTYTWDGDEFQTSGEYIGQFWVGDGVNRFASEYIIWTTCISVNDTPEI